jgi:protein-disulfide isomerase
MMASMRYFWLTAALILALACSAPAQQTPTAQNSDVAARVGDRAITMKEIDDRWRQAEPAEHAAAIQKIYDGRKQALEAIVADMLVEQAAKAKNVATEEYLESEIGRRVTPVAEGEVAAFFQQNHSQMQGRDLAAMSPAIRRFLEEQRKSTAFQNLVAELKKSGPPVRLLLEPPRTDVAVGADDPVLGAANTPVTIVEFSDFQCPFCARVEPTLKRVRQAYGDRVRIVWKDFPLTAIHPQAFKAAEAGQCAREQGKFWEYHDRLFANQAALEPASLKQYAADLGLNAQTFDACLDAAKHRQRVQDQIEVGNRLGVSSTPSAFINGRLVSGAHPYETFAAIIDEELERATTK